MSDERSSGYYARIMGTFWRHPRTSGLSLAARGLWVSLVSWSADQRSDGVVPVVVLPMVCGGRSDPRALAELERAELVEREGQALTLRNWGKHNITREKHDREKERARNGMANKRGTKAACSPPVTRNKPVSDDQPSDQDQDQDQDQTLPSGRVSDAREAEALAVVQLPTKADPIESALRTGYSKRYQAAARDAWLTSHRDAQDVTRAAAWCRAQAEPMEAVERFLGGAFAHPPWARSRWPWKWLAEDPGLTASRSSMAVGTMGGATTMDDAMRAKLAAIPTLDLDNAKEW